MKLVYDVFTVIASGKTLPSGPCSSVKEVEEKAKRYESLPINIGTFAMVGDKEVFRHTVEDMDKRVYDYYQKLVEANATEKANSFILDCVARHEAFIKESKIAGMIDAVKNERFGVGQ